MGCNLMKVVFDLIMSTLKEANIAPVYALGAHRGSVDGKTIVVKPESGVQYMNYSTTVRYFDVLCYGRTASEAVELSDQVRAAMEVLKFTVMPTYTTNMPYWDSTSHGWQISVVYRNYAKNE